MSFAPTLVRPEPTTLDDSFQRNPGYCSSAELWLYGNTRLLQANLAHLPAAAGRVDHSATELNAIEREAEDHVLAHRVLVCGIHNVCHQRVATVPLRWGCSRIVVLSGGFCHHLGSDLQQEMFSAARLWRYGFDAITDLVVSRRAPDKKPTFALLNPTVDRLIAGIATKSWPGLNIRAQTHA